jgi:hypothetical protein
MRSRWLKTGACRQGSGWTQEMFGKAMDEQRGRCAICNEPFEDDVCSDHIETVNRPHPRGLLCRQCNFGLGQFKDNPKVLMSAARYVLAHRPSVTVVLGRPVLNSMGDGLDDEHGNKLL